MDKKLLQHWTPAQREQRRIEKQKALLRWLRTELFTPVAIAADVMGIRGGAVDKTIASLERGGFIVTHIARLDSGRRVKVVGITSHGQAFAIDPGEVPFARTFEPSKLPLSVIDHTWDMQRLRLKCERAGWTAWSYGDRERVWTKGQGRPDVIATTSGGKRVAIEVERTIKTVKRYQAILADRLKAVKAGNFSCVIYTSPTREIANALQAVIGSIETVPVGGQQVKLESRHRDTFAFTTYDTLLAALA